jgi:hypothetical protein
MLKPTLKRTTLVLALASVVLLALVSVARADERTVLPADVQHETESAKQQALATAAPPSASSSTAEGEAGALHAAGEQPAQSEPQAAASGPVLPGQSPPSSPQAAGTHVSEAVAEAIVQARTKQPQEVARVEQGSLAAASNATAQLVWQVEVSQCTSSCYGTKQYQSAEQQNTTRQQITAAPPPAGDRGAPATGERSQATSSVTQLQFGCLSYCFGTTTTQQPPHESYGQLLAELLRQVTTVLSGLSPAPAAEQSVVEQISIQSQTAAGETLTQAQSAAQSSFTVQSYASSPIAGLAPRLGGPQAAGGEAVNQTEQGIWQLQIGCLLLCQETVQYQQAEQSNATLQAVVPAAGSAGNPGASTSDIVTQVIWQVQIGCLFWCFDTTQQQIGTRRNELTVTDSEGAAAPPSQQAAPVSNEAAPPPGTASSQALPEPPAPAPARADAHGSTGAQVPPPLATPPTLTARVRERAAILSEASTGSDRRGESQARSTTAHRPASAGVLRAYAPAGPAERRAQLHHPGAPSVGLWARHLPPVFGAVAADRAVGSSERMTPAQIGVLLAVFALCGVGCLRIAVIRTRRGSHASHQGRLTSE